METIRWGMIGCGDVAEVKSGPALQKAEGRRSSPSCAAIARRRKTTRAGITCRACTTSADDLIDDAEVDAVYIATPPRAIASSP